MAIGHNESRSVRLYLEALTANRPKRGRERTADSIAKRLAAIEEEMVAADALARMHLVQERRVPSATWPSQSSGTSLDEVSDAPVSIWSWSVSGRQLVRRRVRDWQTGRELRPRAISLRGGGSSV
jgi:hypothetical protein